MVVLKAAGRVANESRKREGLYEEGKREGEREF